MLCYPCLAANAAYIWMFVVGLHVVTDLNTHNFIDQRCPEDRIFNALNKKSWKALNGTEHLLQHHSILSICMCTDFRWMRNATLWTGHWLVKRQNTRLRPTVKRTVLATAHWRVWTVGMSRAATQLSTTRSVLIGNCASHHACSQTSISHLVLALKVLACQDASNSLGHCTFTAISATMSQGVTTSRARYSAIVKGHTLVKLTHTHENDARKRQNMVNTLRLNFQLCFWGLSIQNLVTPPTLSQAIASIRRHQSSAYTMLFLQQRTNQVHESMDCMSKVARFFTNGVCWKIYPKRFSEAKEGWASKNQQPRNTQDENTEMEKHFPILWA